MKKKLLVVGVLSLVFLIMSAPSFACSACGSEGLVGYEGWRLEEPYVTYYSSFRQPSPDPAILELTAEEVQFIRDGEFTVALAMHFLADPWTEQIIRGIRSVFDDLNIEIIAMTDAELDSVKQTSDLETIVALEPDVIFSLPTDELAMGPAYQRVAEAGIPLVLTCNIFRGAEHRVNFETAIICNSWDNGRLAAELMAEFLGEQGKVATIEYGVEFYCTLEREIHFANTLAELYPEMELVETRYFTDPDQVAGIAESLFLREPDIQGLFVTWDHVAMNAVSGLRALGRSDVIVVTTDIGDEVSREIAVNGLVRGTATHSAVEQGIMAGKAIAQLLLGNELPLFFRAPSMKVTRDNLSEAYAELQKRPLPAEIQALLD